jgi:Fuc2NAc and GlcNAc transferase
MTRIVIVLGLAGVCVAAVLTALVRRLALSQGALDVPNARSSHSMPTPRGGGLAIVMTTTVGLLVLTGRGAVPFDLCMALVGGGLAVAVVGFLDDRITVPASVRLIVHLLAAVWAVGWLGGLEKVGIGNHIAHPGLAGKLLAMIGITWVLNLFNFMDGIDGIAASEAVFVVCAGAMLVSLGGGVGGVAVVAALFAGACAGFLLWNWPPARIFLGDVGSGYLGYVVAVLALEANRQDSVAVWIWLILGGVFFVDATVTVVRRSLRGERVSQAHRSHTYQRLARRWRSHGQVTLAVMALNLVWLLPCAAAAAKIPRYAALFVIISLAPLAVLAVAIGSGGAETSSSV